MSRARRPALSVLALSLACGDGPADDSSGTGGPTGITVSAGDATLPTGGADGSSDDGATDSSDPPTSGPTGDPSGLPDDAEIVAASLPSALGCGQSFDAAITVRNTGTAVWTHDSHKLGTVDDSDPLFPADTRVWLPEGLTVPPGGEHTFAFTLQAPASPGPVVTDWQMVHEGVQWFGAVASQDVAVGCDDVAPAGVPRLEGRALVDDDGPFLALGATMMWAAWAYKHDRPRLEQNLQFLSEHGFNFIRALGVVGDPNGPDYWDGREIDAHWPDYPEVLAGLTDLAHDGYGLRVEWTLIGDGQITAPTLADKQQLVQTFLSVAQGREHKILHFEIANESWQNGFPGAQGVAELRELTATMRAQSPNLLAASAPPSPYCEDAQAIYHDDLADLATIHFDRDVSKVEGSWRPVRQPWEHQFCAGLPVGSNNEPIGPGSSVAEENDPVRLVAGAVTTYISGLPIYVFHSHAGVLGHEDLWTAPGVDGFAAALALLPPDLPAWDAKNAHWADAPFVVYAGENGQLVPDTMWVDLQSPESGAVRAYGSVREPDFWVFPIGILGSVTVAPRRPMTFDVIDPMTGDVLASHDLDTGVQVELSGAEALLLRGRFK
jgi:hypothetical protein